MLTIDEAIKHCEEEAEAEERSAKLHQRPDRGIKGSGKRYLSCIKCASEHRQLAKWLKELQIYRFEIAECKAILDHPTPDVTENDKKRAMYVLQTFPDMRGEMNDNIGSNKI